MSRVYNFNPGPSTLPLEVLEQIRDELLDFNHSGMSILESSHRGKEYSAVHTEAEQNLRKLLNVPDDYAILFLTGGASAQFAMVPMNLLRKGRFAEYVHTGAWAKKAIAEARIVGEVRISADTSAEKPARIPRIDELNLHDDAEYVHITSNETIDGIQWKVFPRTKAPLVADMSSDILSRPFDLKQFGLIYAGAQKNLGVAGVTVVIIRKDLAERVPDSVPKIFRYRSHIEENSLFNTPPCFAVYILMLMTRWIMKTGLDVIYKQNREKAAILYKVIDADGFYRGTAHPESRSDMNVTFRLADESLTELFIKEASEAGFKGLKGHRTVGGIRASIYNAFPVQGVKALADFMCEFRRKHG